MSILCKQGNTSVHILPSLLRNALISATLGAVHMDLTIFPTEFDMMDLSIGGYVQVYSVHMIVFQDKINVVLFVGHKCDIDV